MEQNSSKTPARAALAAAAGFLILLWFSWHDTSSRLAAIEESTARLEAALTKLETAPAAPPQEITQTASPTINVGDAPRKTKLTAAEFARVKNMSDKQIYRLIEDGKVSPTPTKGENGYYEIDPDAEILP